jgi:hypothetical protein
MTILACEKYMKKAIQRGAVRRGLRAGAVLLTTAALFACGGSGGGGDDRVDTNTPPPVNPGDTFAVSGTINGLTAAVQITDGFETLPFSNDGTFAFTHQYKKGDTFAITVDTGATEQLCTLTHGSGLVLKAIDDVAIDCLEVREANIRVSKPSRYTQFSQLGLRSSYQSIPELAGEMSTLVVAKNQFVTVSTSAASAVPIYLAFVKSFDETRVDSLSTAVSLVMLSPSIHSAIEQREARFEYFATRFAVLAPVVALAEALELDAEAGRLNLKTPSTDLLTLLDAAVIAAAANITASDVAVTSASISTRAQPGRKLVVVPDEIQDGISLTLTKITPDSAGNNYQLQMSNIQQRFVAVESPLLASPVALAPGGSQLQLLKSSAIDQVLWTVFGPGAQAASAPVSASLKQAVIDTATQYYALPSLAFTSGRLAAFDWRLLACVDAATLQQIRDETNSGLQASTVLDDALQAPHYTAAYDAVAEPLRATVASRLDELMECEFFRKGRWLDEHAETAAAQIGTLINIVQGYYAPRTNGANVLVTAGLSAAGDVINSSMTEQQWQLSNRLKITVKQKRNGTLSTVTGTATVNAGEALVLVASCSNPVDASQVPCNVQWTSPQGSKSGDTLNEIPDGSGSITVNASDEDGAAASATIAVTVVERATSYWTVSDGATSQRFDIDATEVLPPLSGDVDQVMQITGFIGASGTFPQISISLPQFAGPGSYLLDDLDSGTACLGAVTTALPQSQLWCTKTTEQFASSPATGTATFSVGAQGQQIVDFDFHVVPWTCVVPSSCPRQNIAGHIEVPSATP